MVWVREQLTVSPATMSFKALLLIRGIIVGGDTIMMIIDDSGPRIRVKRRSNTPHQPALETQGIHICGSV